MSRRDLNGQAAVVLKGVTRSYRGGVLALDDVSLQVPRGAFLAVMGQSGSGKSTLLHCASGLDVPTSGSVTVGGVEISGLREAKRAVVRREQVGFVFQSYNLVPSLDVQQNITLPLRLAGRGPDRRWLDGLVERVGLGGLLHRSPSELSGGQRQRVAVVRALAAKPAVVFADEPTGALDSANAAQILDLLAALTDDLGQTVVMVTHDAAAAARAHDTVVMADGRVTEILSGASADELAARLGRVWAGAAR
ncbi:ABC transporter ATP-binding protein [Phytomonospora endophytica]|uniref:Putative ABC transport system ATP-binding protein n=1 Tax=Phytomonospora endophytica TaxID=714109 RepID=A0A841FFK5_9ACTN|nr:ABC transporter ATP-binding protein [Phytomonospora endophytica]MBB6032618.1 putative ABC transport system ATP-binding protein [Phytomonospora endophytica]GIG66232.1 ABC transporter ATP-binding protein [Phytomonospora endophytica]